MNKMHIHFTKTSLAKYIRVVIINEINAIICDKIYDSVHFSCIKNSQKEYIGKRLRALVNAYHITENNITFSGFIFPENRAITVDEIQILKSFLF